ncbi:hypothetical protein [Marinicella meishanensis]|uniref:hypothetical protein n=1 Tax=Marinicella meishanensis TaxID=2873263 RepID=UPI001CBF79CE|nr:hypothetical protein [Marinicella sp. NBU2979]
MTNRIPSSLKWLVKKRSEKHGELNRLQNEQLIYDRWCKNKIKEIKLDLESIDRTLSLHEIKISPEIIPPKQDQGVGSKLNYGELTKLICEAFETFDNQCATITQLSLYVAAKGSILLRKNITSESLKNSVRYRVKNLCNQGVLERLPKGYKGPFRKYRLII